MSTIKYFKCDIDGCENQFEPLNGKVGFKLTVLTNIDLNESEKWFDPSIDTIKLDICQNCIDKIIKSRQIPVKVDIPNSHKFKIIIK